MILSWLIRIHLMLQPCVVQSFNVGTWGILGTSERYIQWGWKHLRNVTNSPLIRRSRLKLQGSNLPARMAPARTWKTCFGQRWKPQLCSHRLKFFCCSWNDFFSEMIFGKAVGTAKDEGSVTQILIGQFLVEQDYRRVWKVAIQAWLCH